MTRALLAVTLAVGLSAPAQKVNTVGPADRDATPDVEAIERVILNPPLDARVRVGSVYKADADGLLRVQANIANLTDARTWFQYRFDWYDHDGLIIEGPASAWTRGHLLAGQRTSITGIAPTPEAVDWRLTIRG